MKRRNEDGAYHRIFLELMKEDCNRTFKGRVTHNDILKIFWKYTELFILKIFKKLSKNIFRIM